MWRSEGAAAAAITQRLAGRTALTHFTPPFLFTTCAKCESRSIFFLLLAGAGVALQDASSAPFAL